MQANDGIGGQEVVETKQKKCLNNLNSLDVQHSSPPTPPLHNLRGRACIPRDPSLPVPVRCDRRQCVSGLGHVEAPRDAAWSKLGPVVGRESAVGSSSCGVPVSR